LRELAQTTESGAFRPLKSAPNLRRGWIADARSVPELGRALDSLYPGFIPDWYATHMDSAREDSRPTAAIKAGSHGGASVPASREHAGSAPLAARKDLVTSYRDFTNRQTGMYRITQNLTDEQAAAAIRACCHVRFCLKQRLWTVQGQPPDAPQGRGPGEGQFRSEGNPSNLTAKSIIPCLEPCAIMLEFARAAARIEQSPRVQIAQDDVASIAVSLRETVAHFHPLIREADFSAPENPRRLQLVLEKLTPSPTVTE
jgi:hypothetical protein